MLADAPLVVVYGAAIAAATSLVVTRPTQSALLPSLAHAPDQLIAANGATGVIEGAGILIGPLAAAAVLTVSTPATVYVLAGGALIFAAGAMIGLHPAGGLPAMGAVDVDGANPMDGDVDRGFLAGLRTVARDRDARLVVGLLTVRMLMIGAADVLFVLLALDLLDMGEPGAGLLAAALGAGAMVGGAATFTVIGDNRLARVAAIGAVTWGLGLAGIALTASAWLAPLLVVVGGTGLAVVDIAGRTMLQRSIRDEVLSRVFGLQEGLAMAGLAAGSVLVPVLVGLGGLVAAVFAVAAVLPVVVALRWTRLTDLDRRAVVPAREIALLRRTALFRPLAAPQLAAVARRALWLTVPSGTALIREGESGDRYYVLAAGAVRVERAGQHLRDMSTAGGGFGEIALVLGVPRTATVTATTETTLLAIDRAPFLAAVTGHPGAFAAAKREVAKRAM